VVKRGSHEGEHSCRKRGHGCRPGGRSASYRGLICFGEKVDRGDLDRRKKVYVSARRNAGRTHAPVSQRSHARPRLSRVSSSRSLEDKKRVAQLTARSVRSRPDKIGGGAVNRRPTPATPTSRTTVVVDIGGNGESQRADKKETSVVAKGEGNASRRRCIAGLDEGGIVTLVLVPDGSPEWAGSRNKVAQPSEPENR